MNMKKKVFVVAMSFLVASTFSSCNFELSELKIWNKFNKTDKTDKDKTENAVVEISDELYQWDTVKINGGGYISGLVCNEKEKGLMYARTDNGGAFRYDSENGKWISITDFLTAEETSLMSVESIATDNNEPNRVYMVCGSLESNENGVIFSSEDYGQTWERFELSFPCGGDAAGRGSDERLAIDPNDSRTIYYGSRSNGLWKSLNYGKTWTVVPSFNTSGNFAQDAADIGIMWIAFDKASGSAGSPTLNIYAGVADVDGNTIYTSENAGITWDSIATELAGYYPVEAEFSDNGNLYMMFNNNTSPDPDPGSGYIYSYNPQKGEFKDITPENSSAGSGYGSISVSRQNPDMIAISTLGYHYPKDNIYISYDAGETWTTFYDSTADFYNFNLSSAQWLENDMNNELGQWLTSLCIDPFDSTHLIYGTEKGVFDVSGIDVLSDIENPERKVTINDMCDGLEITSVKDIISADGKLYSVVDKWGGFIQTDINSPVTSSEKFSVSGSVDIDCAWNNSDIAVRCGEHSKDASTPVLFTDNGGLTWYSTATVPEGYESFYDGTVCISSDGNSFIWIPDSKSAHPVITDDFGQSWTVCEGLPSGASVCADKVNSMKYYAVSENSFYTSIDGGRTFTRTNSDISENSKPYVSFDEGDVWVLGKQTYHSADGGTSFKEIKGVSGNCMTFGKSVYDNTKTVVYVSGKISDNEYGIYSSEDNGATWHLTSDINKQFGKKASAISADNTDIGRIYIATDGRGIITGKISN